jgi:hypothetical protein
MTSSHTIRTTAAAALLALAMSAPALAQQDLRSADTRDAAIAATAKQDLRSPDASDAARTGEIARQMRLLAGTSQPPAAAPAPQSAVGADTRTPWLPIALMAAFSLAVVAISGAYVHRVRRGVAGSRRTAHAS